MTKLAIFGQAFVAGIAIAAGADQSQSDEAGVMNQNQIGGLPNQALGFEIFSDNELSEFFERGDEPQENQGRLSSPLSPPVFFIKESLLKNPDDKTSNDGSTPLYRRLEWGWDDEKDEDDDDDDDHYNDGDDEYGHDNPNGYQNYQMDEVREHDEMLITDDDDVDEMFSTSVKPPNNVMGSTSSPTQSPTTASSSLDSSFWDGLDAYDNSYEDNRYKPPPGHSGSEDYEESEDYLDDDDARKNSIVLRVSLACVNYEHMTDDDKMDILGMALRTMTVVLNEYSSIPFRVHDKLDEYDRRRGRHRKLEAKDDEIEVGFGVGNIYNMRPSLEHLKSDYLADIILEKIFVDEGDHHFWEVSAVYSVWKNVGLKEVWITNANNGNRGLQAENEIPEQQQTRRRQGELLPVRSQAILTKIEGICDHEVTESIAEGVYWNVLEMIDYGNKDLVLDQNIFYADDTGMIDVRAIGDEYDMWPMFCPIDRPLEGDTSMCPVEMDSEDGFNQIPDIVVDMDCDCDGRKCRCEGTYPNVIADTLSDIEWGNREWVGLALLTATILWTIILSVTAHLVFAKRERQVLWGAALTPNGVDDILKVGWRVYEQPQQEGLSPEQQQAQYFQDPMQLDGQPQPQLFLQVYDKGQGEGYNDENSLLKGGLGQQPFDPPIAAESPPVFDYPQNHLENYTNGIISDPNHPP